MLCLKGHITGYVQIITMHDNKSFSLCQYIKMCISWLNNSSTRTETDREDIISIPIQFCNAYHMKFKVKTLLNVSKVITLDTKQDVFFYR